MKRKQSLIGGLDRILSAREASDLLSISVDELLKYYAGQREISLRNLLKRICRSNPIYHFPHHRRTDLYPKGRHGSNGERPFMVVCLFGEELCPDLVSGCPLSLRHA